MAILKRVDCTDILLDYLKKMQKNKTITTFALAAETGISSSQIRCLSVHQRFLDNQFFVGSARLWGNKGTVASLRKNNHG